MGRILDTEIDRRLPPPPARLLDWGCGRGEAALLLLERGYDAVGIDIDAGRVAKARQLLTGAGLDPGRILVFGDPIPEPPFQFVFSQDVLEHVEDLAGTLRELALASAPGGRGLHTFPARWRLLDPHEQMPLIHWLPPRAPRRWLIRLWLVLHVGRRWPENPNAPLDVQAAMIYEDTRHTFFRSPRKIVQAFQANGIEARVVTAQHRKLAAVPPWLRGAAGWAVTHFSRVMIETEAVTPGR